MSITEDNTFRVMCIQILLCHCWLVYRATVVSLLAQEGHLALPAKHQGMQLQDRKGQALYFSRWQSKELRYVMKNTITLPFTKYRLNHQIVGYLPLLIDRSRKELIFFECKNIFLSCSKKESFLIKLRYFKF